MGESRWEEHYADELRDTKQPFAQAHLKGQLGQKLKFDLLFVIMRKHM